MSSNKRNVFLGFFAVAVVLMAVLAFRSGWSTFRNEEASGAIGAVQKHHEPQIAPQDVVLGDEQAKVEQSIVYGDLLNDAAKLQSISNDFGAMAANKADNSRTTAAAKTLADIDSQLQARYARYAGSFVGAASKLAAKSDNRKLESDVSELGSKINTRLSAVDMEAMNARMGLIIVVCSKIQSRSVDAAQARVAEAMVSLQNRGPEAASKLSAAADSLDARDGASLASIHSALQAIAMESKAVNAAQSRLSSKTLDAKAFDNISADLAQNAIDLESRGLNNLAARMNDEAELGTKLASIDATLNSKAQSINLASATANRADNISAAMSRLNASLAARKADYAARAASMISLNMASLQNYMNSRPQAAARLDARFEARAASNRQAMAKSVAAMRELANRPEVASKVDQRVFSNADALQGRLAAKSN